ncbi:MAG: hypothetical protein V2A72_04210 [Candidatus Omnitrophota bacterium]
MKKFIERNKYSMLAILIIALIYHIFSIITAPVSSFYRSDEPFYACITKSLASGEGNKAIYTSGNPAYKKYPPVYPFMLSLLWRISPNFPENMFLLRQLNICLGLLIIFLYFSLLKKWLNSSLKVFLVLLLFVSNPFFIMFSNSILSDVLYMLLLLLLFYKIEDYKKGKVFLLITALALILFFTRTLGLVVAGSIGAVFLLKKDFKRAGYFSAAVFPCILAWLIYTNSGDGYGYINEFLSHHHNLLEFYFTIAHNLRDVCVRTLPLNVFPALQSKTILGFFIENNLIFLHRFFCVVLSFVVIFGCYAFLRKNRSHFLTLYVIFYAAILIFWRWDSTRYVFGLLPFLYVFLFSGIGKLFSKTWITVLVFVVILTGNLKRDVHMLIDVKQYGHPTGKCVADGWKKDSCLLDWIKRNTDKDEILASTPRYIEYYLYCERRTVDYTCREGENLGFYIKHNVRYIIQHPYEDVLTSEDIGITKMERFRQKYPENIKLVFKCEDSRYAVYEIIHKEGAL